MEHESPPTRSHDPDEAWPYDAHTWWGPKRGCTLIVCGLNSQPGSLLYRAGFIDHLGDDNVCPDLSKALERAYILLPNLMGGDEDY